MMKRKLTLLASLATIGAPALAHAGIFKLVNAGQTVTVAKSRLTVTPSRDWDHLGARAGRNAESWTLDGLSLDDVTFYGGIGEGESLFKDKDKQTKPLPHFTSTMLAPDVVDLFEQSYRISSGTAVFKIDSVVPATFLGAKGFRFDYSFTAEDEVERHGEATGAVIGGKLYLETFEAPRIHYFESVLPAYRQLVDSSALRTGS